MSNYRRPCPCGYGWLLTSEDRACAICTEAKLHKRTHVNDNVPHETMHDSWFEDGKVMRECATCGDVKYFSKAGRFAANCQSCRKKVKRAQSTKPRPVKTHCRKGHEINEQNTRYDKAGKRLCLPCIAANTVKHRLNQEKGNVPNS
jgi:hypothetical protein